MSAHIVGGQVLHVLEGFAPVEAETQVFQTGIPNHGVTRPVLESPGPDGVLRPMRVAFWWSRCSACRALVFPGADEQLHLDWHTGLARERDAG